MTSENKIDAALESVLRAAGSSLSNYSMSSTVEAMRKAMRDVMQASYIDGSNAAHDAMICDKEQPMDDTLIAKIADAVANRMAVPRAVFNREEAANDVIAERIRQREKEGFDAEHDEQHQDNELALAAICYAQHAIGRAWVSVEEYAKDKAPHEWPDKWLLSWWKPKNPRRDLVRAAALLIAHINRMDTEASK